MAAIPPSPVPPRLVNDLAGLFTPAERQQLEQQLTAFNDSTSNQIVILTVTDLDGQEASAYAYEVGETWKVGQEKFNNGVVLLIKPKTAQSYGDVFIAVGYGLEGVLPDAACKTIIDQKIIPQFRQNNYFGGVTEALSVIMPLAAGEYTFAEMADDGINIVGVVIGIIILIIIVVSLIRSNNNTPTNTGSSKKGSDLFTWWALSNTLSGGSHKGSRGGFSGGRSGSFGGFGGGSFGGGGAGGRW
jgi:uncharacterized protein